MKKTSLFLALCCCCTLALAQRKSEFGLVVKSGIYSLPYQMKNTDFFHEGSSTTTTTQKPGNAYVFGIRQSFRLGSHVRISGDFLFRHFSYTTKQTFEWKNTTNSDYYGNRQGQDVNESSISLPINLHFSPRKNGRTSVHFGVGMSQVLRAEIGGAYDSWNNVLKEYDFSYNMPTIVIGRQDFAPNMTISTGFQYRLNQNTSVGLEFNYERRSVEQRFVSAGQFIGSDLCYCYGFLFLEMPSMRSLTVSLSHTLMQ